MNQDQAITLTDFGTPPTGPHYFRMWMPYLFERVGHPRFKHTFLPLNRDYKPLGTSTFADYEAAVTTHGVVFKRNPATFRDIWFKVDEKHGRFWLYNDAPRSRFDYFERFERLMVKSIALVAKQ